MYLPWHVTWIDGKDQSAEVTVVYDLIAGKRVQPIVQLAVCSCNSKVLSLRIAFHIKRQIIIHSSDLVLVLRSKQIIDIIFALHRRVYNTVYSVLSECLWKKNFTGDSGGIRIVYQLCITRRKNFIYL